MSTNATAAVDVMLPAVVDIQDDTDESRKLLIQAVGTPETTVRLAPNLDMDMSGLANVYVANDVVITSDHDVTPIGNPGIVDTAISSLGGVGLPAPAVQEGARTSARLLPPGFGNRPTVSSRIGLSLGPRLHTSTRPKPLFLVDCRSLDPSVDANVHFSGFRLEGPHQDSEEGDHNLERGITVRSCVGVEISNMELSGWSGAAIRVEDSSGYQATQPDAVRIHENYIHHNQHIGGYGYGVDIAPGGHALIDRNVFDFNRHAITSVKS